MSYEVVKIQSACNTASIQSAYKAINLHIPAGHRLHCAYVKDKKYIVMNLH